MDIYTSVIMELASDIRHTDSLEKSDFAPIGRSRKVSKLCGSEISLELQLDKDKIVNFSINPKACALGQASAAILSKNILGSTIDEVKAARDNLYGMLKNGEAINTQRFWEIRYLEPIIDYLPRHASVMLAWDAALAAIEDAQKQESAE